MTDKLMIGIFVALGLVVLCFVFNLIRALTRREAVKTVSRVMFIAGLVATALNLARVALVYSESRATMIVTNAIVILCLVVAFIRNEHAVPEQEEDEAAAVDGPESPAK